MPKINSFHQLNAWKEAHKLVLLIYKITENFPKKEQFVLTSQILRAVISISSNIAEGFSRSGKKDKQQFYFIAKASLTEVQNQIIIAKDLKYIDKNDYIKIYKQSITVDKLISGLIKSASAYKAKS